MILDCLSKKTDNHIMEIAKELPDDKINSCSLFPSTTIQTSMYTSVHLSVVTTFIRYYKPHYKSHSADISFNYPRSYHNLNTFITIQRCCNKYAITPFTTMLLFVQAINHKNTKYTSSIKFDNSFS